MAWTEGWADPHTVQISETTWELRSSSNHYLGRIELRGTSYWALPPTGVSFVGDSLDGTARSLFDHTVHGKKRKPRALPSVGDPYWDDSPTSKHRWETPEHGGPVT